jgi:two-component system, OmpR family, sensor histidine kinase ArlS
MPIRQRIILLFIGLTVVILSAVSISIFYFSSKARTNSIDVRLTNRAITTARLLSREETFDQKLIQKIDSLTTLSLKNKTIQAYDIDNKKVYSYSDLPNDTLHITLATIRMTRLKGKQFFELGQKEVVAYDYKSPEGQFVVFSSAEDFDGKASLQKLVEILFFSFTLGLIFILITAYIFSGRLLQPIKKITAEVEEITAQNLEKRILTSNSKDEWHKLAETLNGLFNRLQESFDMQKRFISNASHELSTPLTSITSQLEVSLQREREAGEYKRVMQSIYHDVRHMSKLTQVLLQFAKASGSEAGLELDLVRLDEIILHLPSEVAKMNTQYNVSIEFINLPDDEEKLLVFGNETLLVTAIKNIVANACKYSPDHKADVLLEVKKGSIVVSVRDRGKGIPESDLNKVFLPFYRVEDNIGSGSGLGLALADRIIKLHKGSIEVNSTLNVGTVFTIYLPMGVVNSHYVVG